MATNSSDDKGEVISNSNTDVCICNASPLYTKSGSLKLRD